MTNEMPGGTGLPGFNLLFEPFARLLQTLAIVLNLRRSLAGRALEPCAARDLLP